MVGFNSCSSSNHLESARTPQKVILVVSVGVRGEEVFQAVSVPGVLHAKRVGKYHAPPAVLMSPFGVF
eukprot:6466330-Amphidinium_carterae.1